FDAVLPGHRLCTGELHSLFTIPYRIAAPHRKAGTVRADELKYLCADLYTGGPLIRLAVERARDSRRNGPGRGPPFAPGAHPGGQTTMGRLGERLPPVRSQRERDRLVAQYRRLSFLTGERWAKRFGLDLEDAVAECDLALIRSAELWVPDGERTFA